ncbi:hypothetical protein ACUN9V_18770 [Salinicola sp. V024]|uniref:hypothetical protein n=1 Tax=Salinicola sp. V024 TaxID=3459609 RepID=UPI004044B5B7
MDHYPTGGAGGVRPHLQETHTDEQIRAMASRLGVKRGKPFLRGEETKALIGDLEREYRTGRPDLKKLAARHHVDYYWLKHVAAKRGLATTKYRRWPPEVDALIQQMDGTSPDVIYRRLKSLGYCYPLSAVAQRQQQLGNSTADSNLYTPHQLSEALGMTSDRINRWIDAGRLKVTRRSTHAGTPNTHRFISTKALRDFIIAHPGEIDLRRIVPAWQPWFIDMLTNKTADVGYVTAGTPEMRVA